MKTTALVLCVLVPFTAFAQQKTELLPSPSFEQAGEPAVEAAVDESVPLHKRWYVWAAAGAVVATIAAAVAYGVVASTKKGAETKPTDFSCYPSCAGYVNVPSP